MCTRVNTLPKKLDEVTHSLLETTVGVNVASPTKAIKHGRALEPHAKRKYVSEFRRKHLNFNSKDIGLVLFKQYPYLGASPDLILECTCCGKGVVEIKCPSSIAGEKPSYENYSHLEVTEKGDCRLKENSPYSYQMYGQMAATESKYCDFFAYTKYGFYVERVTFNQSIWEEIVGKLSWFWENYVGPNFAKGTFVLGEREEMGEKTHNVTSDVDFSFSITLNTKPISIKLK